LRSGARKSIQSAEPLGIHSPPRANGYAASRTGWPI